MIEIPVYVQYVLLVGLTFIVLSWGLRFIRWVEWRKKLWKHRKQQRRQYEQMIRDVPVPTDKDVGAEDVTINILWKRRN